MSFGATASRWIVGLLSAAALVVMLPASAALAGPLEPYRAFARSADGARLLAIARATLMSPDSIEDEAEAEEAFADSAGEFADEDAPADPDGLGWPGPPVAVYLTLVGDGGTRACIGVPAPGYGTLSETVRELALDALVADRRRPPVRQDELAGLRVVIAFADEGVPIVSPNQVDPGRDGLAIDSERGSIAFLPGEARTVSWALAEARRAGILGAKAGEVHYRKFRVVTLGEPKPRRARAARSRAEEEPGEPEAGR